MRKLTPLLLLLVATQAVFAQIDSVGLDRFNYLLGRSYLDVLHDMEMIEMELGESAMTHKEFARLYKRKLYENALDQFDYVVTKYPQFEGSLYVLDKKGDVELRLGKVKEARKTFLTIIEKCRPDTSMEDFARNGLINSAMRNLANICIIESDYKRALELLDSLKAYPRVYMCPSAGGEDQIRINQLYGKCYVGNGKVKKGLDLLLPQILDYERPYDSTHVDFTFSTLVKIYGKEGLRKKFKEAFDHYQIKDHGKYKTYHVEFLGASIRIESSQIDAPVNDTPEEVAKLYNRSKFYRLLFD